MNAPRFALIPCSQIAPRKISWLWWPYLPQGKLAVLEGPPGAGKTWAAAGIASLFTQGHFLRGSKVGPDEPPGKVFFLNRRDDPAEILRPRLEACGADLSHAVFLKSGEEDGGALDLEELSGILKKEKPALLVLDPLEDFLENADTPREVRRFSRKLAALADKSGCTILALRRRARGKDERARTEAFDSQTASVLQAAKDPDNPGNFVLVHALCRHEAEDPRLGFKVHGGKFEWIFPSQVTTAGSGANGRALATQEARQLLHFLLGQGPRRVGEIFEAAESEGVHRKSLYRAKKILGVRSRQGKGYWWWQLPPAKSEELSAAAPSRAPAPSTPDDPQARRNSHRPALSQIPATGKNPYAILDALYALYGPGNPDDPDSLSFSTEAGG